MCKPARHQSFLCSFLASFAEADLRGPAISGILNLKVLPGIEVALLGKRSDFAKI
jgi:hypothetical protein